MFNRDEIQYLNEVVAPKLDPEVKAKWVAALRSGEFQQAQGTLYRPAEMETESEKSGYCCLGILCKIGGLEYFPELRGTLKISDEGDWVDNSGNIMTSAEQRTYAGGFGPTRATDFPPVNIVKWSGLDDACGSFQFNLKYPKDGLFDEYVSGWRNQTLAELNDDSGWSFDEIADFIEKYF